MSRFGGAAPLRALCDARRPRVAGWNGACSGTVAMKSAFSRNTRCVLLVASLLYGCGADDGHHATGTGGAGGSSGGGSSGTTGNGGAAGTTANGGSGGSGGATGGVGGATAGRDGGGGT